MIKIVKHVFKDQADLQGNERSISVEEPGPRHLVAWKILEVFEASRTMEDLGRYLQQNSFRYFRGGCILSHYGVTATFSAPASDCDKLLAICRMHWMRPLDVLHFGSRRNMAT